MSRPFGSAREQGFVQNEGTGVRVGRAVLCGAWLRERSRMLYLAKARHCYRDGEPTARCGNSMSCIRTCREKEPSTRLASGTIGAPVEHLDLATVLKVSQAVSGEMVLDKLLETLMRTAIEHAGAERGLLILLSEVMSCRSRRKRPPAASRCHRAPARQQPSKPRAAGIARPVMSRVPGSTVILDDAASHNPFSADPYIRQRHARSILCLPLDQPGKTYRCALPRKQPDTSRLHSGADCGAETACFAGRYFAGEYAPLYATSRNAKQRSGGWWTPISSASSSGISKVALSRPTTRFSAWWDTSREDLLSGRVRWKEITPDKWRAADEQRAAELKLPPEFCEPFREGILPQGRQPRASPGWCRSVREEDRTKGVAFVLDLTERKRAEEELRRSEAYLAEAQRLTQHGQLGMEPGHRQH